MVTDFLTITTHALLQPTMRHIFIAYKVLPLVERQVVVRCLNLDLGFKICADLKCKDPLPCPHAEKHFWRTHSWAALDNSNYKRPMAANEWIMSQDKINPPWSVTSCRLEVIAFPCRTIRPGKYGFEKKKSSSLPTLYSAYILSGSGTVPAHVLSNLPVKSVKQKKSG